MPKISTEWNVEWDGPIKLPALTQRMHDNGLGREDLVEVLRARNDELVTGICGPKYHPIEGCRYERAGTKKRTLGTRFGLIELRVNRVRDRNLATTIIPIWDDVEIIPKRIYQDDVTALTEHAVIRMTYRNTNEELSRTITGVPSPHTINRRVMEDGAALADEIHARDLVATTIQPDGTKLHSQSGGHDNVNVILATKGRNRAVRSITVGRPWKDHLPYIMKTEFQDDMGRPCLPTFLSDMEPALKELVEYDNGYWQPCVVHVVRYTGIALWKDTMKYGPEKSGILRRVAGLMKHLKNSLDYHLPRGEHDAVRHRIKQTIKEFRRLATILINDGRRNTAWFLREMSNVVTTYATLALQGITIPDTNNLLERLMGEVSKRCKHKWMSWTPKGALGLLTLLVVRFIEPATHDAFWRRKLYGAVSALSDLGVRITRLG